MTGRRLIAAAVGAAVFTLGAVFVHQPPLALLRLALLGAALGAVVESDLTERRIPNRIVVPAALACAAALQTLAGEPGTRSQAAASNADVQVEVTRRVPTILLRLVGVSTLTVGAHATAAPREP